MATRKGKTTSPRARRDGSVDAVIDGFRSVAAGKVGSSRDGVRIDLGFGGLVEAEGDLKKSLQSKWWNVRWKVNPDNPTSKATDPKLFRAMLAISGVPLYRGKGGKCFLELDGEAVGAIRAEYRRKK